VETFKGITLEDLKRRFEYNPSTGDLIHKRGRFKDQKVGTLTPEGYLATTLYDGMNKKSVSTLLHRLIYFLQTGTNVPEGCIMDHINHDRVDNRWENLRVVTPSENSRNRAPRKRKDNYERFLKTSTWGVILDTYTGFYYAMAEGKILDKVADYDEAKYARWNWEYDNGYHENNSVNPP